MREYEQIREMKNSKEGAIIIEYEHVDMFEALKLANWFLKKCYKDEKNATKAYTYKTADKKKLIVFARYRHQRKKNAFVIVIEEKM